MIVLFKMLLLFGKKQDIVVIVLSANLHNGLTLRFPPPVRFVFLSVRLKILSFHPPYIHLLPHSYIYIFHKDPIKMYLYDYI